MKRSLPIALAGLLVGGCGSMAKQSPGELVAQRVPPEPAGPPAPVSAGNGNASLAERHRLDELLPDSAQVCIPAHLVQVQLRSGKSSAAVPEVSQGETIVRHEGATGSGGPSNEVAELERLHGLAQQLLVDRK